jgi:hypothetical protein
MNDILPSSQHTSLSYISFVTTSHYKFTAKTEEDTIVKKIAVMLAAGALLAVVSPMAMAANLNFNGKVKSEMNYNISNPAVSHVKDWNGQSNVELGASLGDTMKAGISINGLQRDFITGWQNTKGFSTDPTQPNQILTGSDGISIDKAWVSADGSLWNNGPQVTTRFGSLNAQYSPLVASVTDPGVSVDANFGKLTVGAFNAWHNVTDALGNADATAQPGYGVHAALNSNGNGLGATIVKVANQQSYAIDGQVKPTEKLTMNGAFANQENQDNTNANATMVGANYQLTENLGIHGGYRNFETGFNPQWRNTDMITNIEGGFDPDTNNLVTDNYAKKGFNVGVSAKLAGFDVTSDLGLYKQQADDLYQGPEQTAGSKHQELKTTISRDFVFGSSKLTAGISQKYDFKSNDQEDLDANLKYTAPNGLTAEVNRDFESDETTFSTGLNMQF